MAVPIENYLPGVRDNGGITTNEPATFTGNVSMTGSSNTIKNPNFTGAGAGILFGTQTNVINLGAGTTASPISLAAASSGSYVLFTSSAGTFVTLPAPSIGLEYWFVMQQAPVGATIAIFTNNTQAVVINGALTTVTSNNSVGTFYSQGTAGGKTTAVLSFSGATSGGSAGTYFSLICSSLTTWTVCNGLSIGSGVLVTPFGLGQ